jgi:NAD(P)-dependent dehydrogenase (short-subunit alcohol dehydrogenase family)
MATNKSFGERTGASEVARTFSSHIHGKVILIVGVGPNSLGESKAAALASQSPSLLILASRTLSKIKEVANKLSCPTATVEVDLSSYSSVRTAAKEIASLTPRIDILINNAAIVHPSLILTSEAKHELQFATTFLGPFLLTNLLLPQLLTSALSPTNTTTAPFSTRIINVTSAGHRISPIRFSDPHFSLPLSSLPESERPSPTTPQFFLPKTPQDTYAPFLAYGQSKTANILFSVALNRRLASVTPDSGGIASFSVHPGSIWTELSRNLDNELQEVIKGTGAHWKDLDAGSATALVAALDPALVQPGGGVKGVYLSDCQVDGSTAEHATDGEIAERLWKLAEQEVGENFAVEELVRRMVAERGDRIKEAGSCGQLKGRVGPREVKV